ncbi:heavy-metal-associated domain-containing protein [Rhodocaloribacter sp.]
MKRIIQGNTGPSRPAWGKALGLLALLAFFTMTALAPEARAQDDKRLENPDVIVEVGGLACPFCAYGIEKRLKKLDEVAELSVLLEEGKVELKVKEGAKISEASIRKAVADAGFEAKSVVFVNENVKAPAGE